MVASLKNDLELDPRRGLAIFNVVWPRASVLELAKPLLGIYRALRSHELSSRTVAERWIHENVASMDRIIKPLLRVLYSHNVESLCRRPLKEMKLSLSEFNCARICFALENLLGLINLKHGYSLPTLKLVTEGQPASRFSWLNLAIPVNLLEVIAFFAIEFASVGIEIIRLFTLKDQVIWEATQAICGDLISLIVPHISTPNQKALLSNTMICLDRRVKSGSIENVGSYLRTLSAMITNLPVPAHPSDTGHCSTNVRLGSRVYILTGQCY